MCKIQAPRSRSIEDGAKRDLHPREKIEELTPQVSSLSTWQAPNCSINNPENEKSHRRLFERVADGHAKMRIDHPLEGRTCG